MSTSTRSPSVTVVLPTHDRPRLLAEAIASVRAQTWENWDLIVVDDASDPPASIPDDPRCALIRNVRSRGGAEAKNAGAFQARGDVLAFLDDDDLYAPSYLQRAVAALAEDPELDVVFMGVSWFGERSEAGQRAYEQAMGALLSTLHPFSSPRGGVLAFEPAELFRGLLRTVPMAFQRPVVRRSSFERIGPYQADILLWDCDWAIRAALQARCGLVTDGLYMQRASGQGFSSKSDRQREHLRSNALMKQRLLEGKLEAEGQAAVRDALVELWFGAAWSSSQGGDQARALEYLWNSARIRLELGQLRLLARILARAIGLVRG